MKGPSEGKVREALERLAEDMPLTWYKPPDDARNWKPADYLVWVGPLTIEGFTDGSSAMIEVKDNPNLATYPFSDLRPAQRGWIRVLGRVGVPYWLVIWWRRRQRWTISDAAKVIAFIDDEQTAPIKSIHWMQLAGNMGVDCEPKNLAGTLGAALRGEIG